MGKNLAIGYASTEHKNGRRHWERITVGFGLDQGYLPKLPWVVCEPLSHVMVAYRATQVQEVHELLANGALDSLSRCGCGKREMGILREFKYYIRCLGSGDARFGRRERGER